jgi:TolB-like protein/lipoprotein NlpI
MGDDEQKAFEILKKNREIHQPIIDIYKGKLIKELGDGILASFPTVSEALSAAIKIQQACSASKELSLRIGIHEGEIISENNDIYGDAVNIASRIQTLGIPGSILFSKKVADELKNKLEFHTVSLGSFEFKNVNEPIEVFALTNDGFPVPKRSMMEGKLKKKNLLKRNVIAGISIIMIVIAAFFIYKKIFYHPKFTGKEKSIVVLPFTNMSTDRENEYFSDGMTEEITTQLSKIADLKVIARTSAMAYKDSKKSIKDISEDLSVAAILKGSVQKIGNEIKITAQLIDANTQEHIWADKYEKDLKDVFYIQNEVARHIAVALQTKLFATVEKQTVKKETESIEAYNLYLKGRYYLNKGKEDDLKKALAYFGQAIQNDPGYAKAWSGRADVYLMLGEFEYLPGIEAWPKAEEAVKKALELDETSADAHKSLGHLSIHLYNWPVAKRELKRAIELSPTHSEAHHFMSQYLAAMGRMDESIAEVLLAQELDPLSLLVSSNVGLQFYRARRMNEAMELLRKTLELQSDYPRAHRNLARVYMAKGMHQEAIAEFEKSLSIAKNNSTVLGFLGNAYGHIGERGKALKILNDLKIVSNQKAVSGEIALIYIGLGEKDLAFEWLDKAIRELSVALLQIKVDPEFDNIRTDARYNLVLKKMGLE